MDKNNRPYVCVITVTCNDAKNLQTFLPSLMASEYSNFSLLVVDNASNKDQQEFLKTANPRVKVLFLEQNRGYAGACNAGITYALENSADYVFLLNNDTAIAPEAISELVNVAEQDRGVGVVGPLLLHMDPPDRIQEFGGEIDVCRAEISKHHENETFLDNLPELKQVTFIGGGVSLICAEVFKKVGLLDESYFLYYDEVDFDLRVAAQGYRLVVTSKAKVWHDLGYTRLTKLRLFFSIRNQFHFARSHNNFPQFVRFNLHFAFFKFPTIFSKVVQQGAFDVLIVCFMAWFYGLTDCMDIKKAKKLLKLR